MIHQEAKSDGSNKSSDLETRNISLDLAKSQSSADLGAEAVATAGEPTDVTIKSAPADSSPVAVGDDGEVIDYSNF